MKLRLYSDTLRLRLSQSEVVRLAETGRVEESITFAPGRVLSYAIESGTTPRISAAFDGDRVRVLLPASVAKAWIESQRTGVEGVSDTLRVLVEKDYVCLHRSSPEDVDAFPNPIAAENDRLAATLKIK
jgi:hypothetical protein